MGKPPITFEYDADTDVATIEGTKFHGDLLRFWGQTGQVDVGKLFMVTSKDDGVLSLFTFDQAIMLAAMDWACGKWCEYGDFEKAKRLQLVLDAIKAGQP
jgi:hypothetical protein